jgi:ArsR family transcriptional regulator
MGKPAKVPLDYNHLHSATDIMRALAHPFRLRIIALLHKHPDSSVQTIHTNLGVEQSIVSQHLRILRMAALVQTRRQGKNVHYLLDEQRLVAAAQVAGQLAKLVLDENDDS